VQQIIQLQGPRKDQVLQEVGKGLDDGGSDCKQFETADTFIVRRWCSLLQRNVRDPSVEGFVSKWSSPED
jgi:hypothetical protein